MKKSKFSEAQIVRILQEEASGSKTVAEVCREHGMSQNTYTVLASQGRGHRGVGPAQTVDLERENDAI